MNVSAMQIQAQLERVLAGDSRLQVVAIRATAKQMWPDVLQLSVGTFRVRWCESSLAMREALCEWEQQNPMTWGMVLLTPLLGHEMAEDIVARVARARLFEPEGWDMARSLFQAKETDVRLGQWGWMPQALIDAATQGPYPPVANGFLDLETAWREVLARFLGLELARPDVMTVLEWTQQATSNHRLAQLPPSMRTDVIVWLAQAGGPAGELVLSCVASGYTHEALPLGLVCGVVFAPDAQGEMALGQAAVRLERFVNHKRVGAHEGRLWAAAARQLVKGLSTEEGRIVADRADALLKELGIAAFAHLSDVLPSGLELRLLSFAVALGAHGNSPSQSRLEQVEETAHRVLNHTLMNAQPVRSERVEMARRLARWLVSDPVTAGHSFNEMAQWQADQGAYVDWARFRLLGGDELSELSAAYIVCRQAVTTRRQVMAHRFANALTDWNTQPPQDDGRIVPIEQVLDRVLAPIGKGHPVLLLVMDGLSHSIFRELFARASHHGWSEVVSTVHGQPLLGVAAIPTITEVSRTSLLCGRLSVGAQNAERTGFATHPTLLQLSRNGHPPKVFHKGDLAEDGNLSPAVRAMLTQQQQQIIAVVYNAVDDHLNGPHQLHQRWMLEELRLLLPLLREAREARRVLIVTADHGHLLDEGTTQVKGGENDRWRYGDNAVLAQEMLVQGGRVRTSSGSQKVVALWDECSRYTSRKNGYHGGLTPQEVMVPLSVFVPIGVDLSGWQAAPPHQPDWWDSRPPSQPPLMRPFSAKLIRKKTTTSQEQPELFDTAGHTDTDVLATSTHDWIAHLFVSPVYQSQKQLAARVALPDDKMRLLLEALSERGGKQSKTLLASRLGVAELRISGLLTAARRVLNVDQASVLAVDEQSGFVELNLPLLKQQYSLG